MRTFLSLLAGAGLALGVVTMANAGEEPLKGERVTGKVVATDASAQTLSIETETGDRIMFKTDDATKFKAAGKPIELDRVAVGSNVKVDASLSDEAGLIATSVEVQDRAGKTPPVSAPAQRTTPTPQSRTPDRALPNSSAPDRSIPEGEEDPGLR
jgi:hypothetical protein